MSNPNSCIWPQDIVVRIVTSDIFSGDAIGNFNIQIREFLTSKNIPCKLYAQHFDETQDLGITAFEKVFLEIQDSDVVFSHFSIYEKCNEMLSTIGNPKLVYYHGITPPEYFRDYDPITEENCSKGRQQYQLFKNFDYFLSNSNFMLNEFSTEASNKDIVVKQNILSKSSIIPPFISSLSLLNDNKSANYTKSNNVISFLYVGRIAPHKCIHELFPILSGIVKSGFVAQLIIVGSVAGQSYFDELIAILDKDYAHINQFVEFVGHVSDQELIEYYATSDIFITMSEHEGFCLPLMEAMHHSLPVIAKGVAAIPETLSDSGIIYDGKDIAGLVGSIVELIKNDQYRNNIVSRQNLVYADIIKRANGDEILKSLSYLIEAQ